MSWMRRLNAMPMAVRLIVKSSRKKLPFPVVHWKWFLSVRPD